ncbi:MAG: hypothetical protein FK733_04815 [Asgard group archaeon]|nr:hypothetical protein [Asgard group archaeon]
MHGKKMCFGHPRRHKHFPPMMGKRFMFRGFEGGPLKMILDDIDSKEEAIELLEIQIKRLNKQKKHLEQKISQMDEMEKSIEEAISEIGGMKEFSKDDMKKILKKKYREFTSKMLDD